MKKRKVKVANVLLTQCSFLGKDGSACTRAAIAKGIAILPMSISLPHNFLSLPLPLLASPLFTRSLLCAVFLSL